MHTRVCARVCVRACVHVRGATVARRAVALLSRCCRAAVAFARRTCGDGCRCGMPMGDVLLLWYRDYTWCATVYRDLVLSCLACGCVRGARAAGCAGRGLAVSVGRGSASFLRLARSVGPWSVRDRVRRVTGPSAPRSVRPTDGSGLPVGGPAGSAQPPHRYRTGRAGRSPSTRLAADRWRVRSVSLVPPCPSPAGNIRVEHIKL